MGRPWRNVARSVARVRAIASSLVSAACYALLAGSWSAVAHAQGHSSNVVSATTDYSQLIERAISAFDDQRFGEARTLFEQAHALAPSARTLRGLGVTAYALNHYTQARPELEAALTDTRNPLTLDQQSEVKGILDWMQANLGTLRLQVSPSYAVAMVDARAIATGANLLEPGEHSLHVQASEYAPHDENFVLERARPLDLRVELAALTREPRALADPPIAPASARLAPGATPAASDDVGAAPRDQAAGSKSIFERWWFWTLAGVVVGGTAIALVSLAQEPASRALPAGVRVGTH